METFAIAEKSKSTSAVALHKNKQQPFFAPVKVQPKLTIGAVNDPYEREADAMADRVMRMRLSGTNPIRETFFKPVNNFIQRQTPAATETPTPTHAGTPGDVLQAVIAYPQVNHFLENLGQQFLLTVGHTWDDPSHLGKIGILSVGGSLLAGIGLSVYAARNDSGALDLMSSPLSGTVFRLPASFTDAPLPLRALGLEANFDRPSSLSPLRNNMVALHVDVGLLLQNWAPGLGFGRADSLSGIGAPPSADFTISRKCASCEEEKKLQREEINPTSVENGSGVPEFENYVGGLSSSGTTLSKEARSFFEPRMGYDFSNVKIHTDSVAAKSAGSINAFAYTSGNNVVFNSGQYNTTSDSGKKLLAHELTHVIQQKNSGKRINRFSDDTHHIIEEAALQLLNEETLTKLDSDKDAQKSASYNLGEIEKIHEGNTSRDYSQVPHGQVTNFLLLCNPKDFGGYKDYEHFDNFMWDKEMQKWQSRDRSPDKPKTTPLDYIESQLKDFVEKTPSTDAFVSVGNAFHTIEDFFAHSNFIELANNDYRFGKELITGSVPATDDTSVIKIFENLSGKETRPYYERLAEESIASAPEGSHAKIAKDYATNPYQMKAVVLAGLVIKDIASDLKILTALKTKKERMDCLQNVILLKIKRYIQPPGKDDKWWETLLAMGGGAMKERFEKIRAATPVTVNQCTLSPLRNIEAIKDSPMKLFGPSIPVKVGKRVVWINGGPGFSISPPQNDDLPGTIERRETSPIKFGLQITGEF